MGDFPGTIQNAPAPPDIIFFDPFSSKTDGDQWTLGTFRRILTACAGRAVELFTYSCSTPVRSALLAAGFYVARGCSTGDKAETTFALTPAAVRNLASPSGPDFLAGEWLGKWNRSSARYPADLPEDEQTVFEQAIRNHPQFQNV